MVDISIITPSLRKNSFLQLVSNLKKMGCPYSYEIISCGPFEVDDLDSNIKFFKSDNKEGSVTPANFCYTQSTGKHIVVVNDDMQPLAGWWECIDKLYTDEYDNRKFKVVGLNVHPIYLPKEIQFWGDAPCDPKHLNASFPVFKRETIENELNNTLWNCSYKHSDPDTWLGYFLSANGEQYREMPKRSFLPGTTETSNPNHMFYDHAILYKMLKLHSGSEPCYQAYNSVVTLTYEEMEKVIEIHKNVLKEQPWYPKAYRSDLND